MKKFENLRKGDFVRAKYFNDKEPNIYMVVGKMPNTKHLNNELVYWVRSDDGITIQLWKTVYMGSLTRKEVFAHLISSY